MKNVEHAQEKQKEHFARHKAKGVKSFTFNVGDIVLRRVMKNLSRKGGKTEPLWTGPYRYVSKSISGKKDLVNGCLQQNFHNVY